MKKVTCYLGIGSNVGDRRFFIEKAIEELGKNGRVEVKRVSSIYETDPVSDIPQDKFLNGVIEVETDLEPRRLLNTLNAIEASLGRERTGKDAPRTLDLDILYYGDSRLSEEGLEIPHPRIEEREFVQRGLRELGILR